MSTTSAYRAGLQSLALALVFMPEPVTTLVGLGLLSVARHIEKERPNNFRRLPKTLDEHFDYRIALKSGSLLTVEMVPRKHGQLPRAYPRAAGLQDNPEVFKAIRENSSSPQQKKSPRPYPRPPALLRDNPEAFRALQQRSALQQKKSPRPYPRLPALLKDNPEAFRALQQRSALQQTRSTPATSNTEPAGLLKPSVARTSPILFRSGASLHTASRRLQRL